jgi:hypothetical protein
VASIAFDADADADADAGDEEFSDDEDELAGEPNEEAGDEAEPELRNE